MFLLWLRQFPGCGDQTPASVPPPTEGRSRPTNAPVFLPSSFIPPILVGSVYSFPLVRYSRLLSAGVLQALLCLQVYSWCIRGERCILCPPTPPPSCSPYFIFNKQPHMNAYLVKSEYQYSWSVLWSFTPKSSTPLHIKFRLKKFKAWW